MLSCQLLVGCAFCSWLRLWHCSLTSLGVVTSHWCRDVTYSVLAVWVIYYVLCEWAGGDNCVVW